MANCNPQFVAQQAACFASCVSKAELTSVQNYLYCQILNQGLIMPAVLNWVQRVINNGGAKPSQATIMAVNTFYSTLSMNGLVSKIVALCMFVPDNLIAAITPLINNGGNDPWTNNNFVTGDLSVNGLAGDGATKFLNTGVVPSTNSLLASTNAGMSMMTGTVYNPATIFSDNGAYDAAATDAFELSYVVAPNTFGFAAWNYGLANNQVANGGFLGFCSGSVPDQTGNAASSTLYHASSTVALVGSNRATASNMKNVAVPIYWFARDQNGVTGQFTGHTLSFGCIHQGLTFNQTNTLFNAVQALRQSLGGGFA